MDAYRYCCVGPDSSLTTDGLHCPGFPLLLWDVLQSFGYLDKLDYHGRVCHKFQIGHCKVHIDIPLNANQPSWMAWSMSATGHDMSDTLEKVAHQALEMFCEQHLVDTDDTPIALFPIQNWGDKTWRRCMKAACDETQPTLHTGYAMSTLYAQHVCNLLHEVEMANTFQRIELKDYGLQIAELKKANRELTKRVKLLRQNASDYAGERRDYKCLLMESQIENDHHRSLLVIAHEDEYAKKYS
jgi:hypothetical protein